MLCKTILILILLAFITKISEAQRHPLYRCLSLDGKDHFVSKDPKCEEQKTEMLLGYVFDDAIPVVLTSAIYRCLNKDGDHFVSLSKDCQGSKFEGLLGYVYTYQRMDVASNALYQCITDDGHDHSVSYAVNCEVLTQKTESLLGYIRTQD